MDAKNWIGVAVANTGRAEPVEKVRVRWNSFGQISRRKSFANYFEKTVAKNCAFLSRKQPTAILNNWKRNENFQKNCDLHGHGKRKVERVVR